MPESTRIPGTAFTSQPGSRSCASPGASIAPGSPGARAAAACPLPAEVFADADVRRLCKRLRRTGDHLFTFLDYPQIPFKNNFAERQIRPAVILRKNSQSNRSDRGARTQAVLMSAKGRASSGSRNFPGRRA